MLFISQRLDTTWEAGGSIFPFGKRRCFLNQSVKEVFSLRTEEPDFSLSQGRGEEAARGAGWSRGPARGWRRGGRGPQGQGWAGCAVLGLVLGPSLGI